MHLKTMIKYHLTPVRMVIINKSTNNRCWWGCGEKGTLVHCWYGCKLVYPPWKIVSVQFSSVQLLSCFRIFATHESQHARPPCPSPTPGVHSDSRPSSPWCHPDISSSVIPFSSCPQSLPASESSPTPQFKSINSSAASLLHSPTLTSIHDHWKNHSLD